MVFSSWTCWLIAARSCAIDCNWAGSAEGAGRGGGGGFGLSRCGCCRRLRGGLIRCGGLGGGRARLLGDGRPGCRRQCSQHEGRRPFGGHRLGLIAIMLPGGGGHGAAQAEQRHDHALRPFAHRPFAGRLEAIHLDFAWPDILDLDIAHIGVAKRRFNLRNWRADRNLGARSWTCGAAEGRPDRAPAVGAFSACACSSVSIAKTSCGSVSFGVGVDCIGGPLLSPMSPASGGEHALRRGKPSAQKALSKPPHGQRGLTKARRSRGEVGAAGSRGWNRSAGKARRNRDFPDLAQNAPGVRSAAS